jgi:cation diffusion facilitator CzcD-associated flavoprotein CzcO
MKNVARKYNIYAHIQFETEVIRAVWITERRQWRIDLRTVSEKGYTESSVHYDILQVQYCRRTVVTCAYKLL